MWSDRVWIHTCILSDCLHYGNRNMMIGSTLGRVYCDADLSQMADKFLYRNELGVEMLSGPLVEFCPKTLAVGGS